MFLRTSYRLILMTIFSHLPPASCFCSLVQRRKNEKKEILYLSIIQENYSAEHILTLQENETAIENNKY